MKRRKLAGRRLIFYGALLLFCWAGYEFFVRAETIAGMMNWAINWVTTIAVGERIPFNRMAGYFWVSAGPLIGQLMIPLFLLALVLFAVLALALRNRPWGSLLFLLPVSALLCLMSTGMLRVEGGSVLIDLTAGLTLSTLLQALKIVPLLLIAVGAIVNFAHFCAARRARGEVPADSAAPSKDERPAALERPARGIEAPPAARAARGEDDAYRLTEDADRARALKREVLRRRQGRGASL